MYSLSEIQRALAEGRTVTAIAADLERKQTPRRGAEVRVTEVFDTLEPWDNRWSVRASGYRARFRAEITRVEGVSPVSGPDTY